MPPENHLTVHPLITSNREWFAPPWRERRQWEDRKPSGFSRANIDFRLDAFPNDDVSYCSRLIRFAEDCGDPILMHPRPTQRLTFAQTHWYVQTDSVTQAHICIAIRFSSRTIRVGRERCTHVILFYYFAPLKSLYFCAPKYSIKTFIPCHWVDA